MIIEDQCRFNSGSLVMEKDIDNISISGNLYIGENYFTEIAELNGKIIVK